MNLVVLTGRITKDADMKITPSGTEVCHFTLAVDKRIKKEDSKPDYINCVAWKKTAEYMAKWVKKGTLLAIEGSLNQVSKEDGTSYLNVNVDNVQLLAKSNQNEQNGGYNADSRVGQANTSTQNKSDVEDFLGVSIDLGSDELPF